MSDVSVLTPERIKEIEDKARADYIAEQAIIADVKRKLALEAPQSVPVPSQGFGQMDPKKMAPIYSRDKGKTPLELVNLEIESIEQNRLAHVYQDVDARLAQLKAVRAEMTKK